MKKTTLFSILVLAGAIGCGGGSNPTGAAGSTGSGGTGGSGSNPNLAKYSFFVVSLDAVRRIAGDQMGLGGDLRHGETGEGAGLRGARLNVEINLGSVKDASYAADVAGEIGRLSESGAAAAPSASS